MLFLKQEFLILYTEVLDKQYSNSS